MRNSKQTIWVILGALAAANAFASDGGGFKGGVVDLPRVVQSVGDGAQAKIELDAELKKKQKVFDEKQKKAKAVQESLSMVKPEARAAKEAELQREGAELQQMYMQMQQEMVRLEQEKMAVILNKTNTILQSIGKEGDYAMIFNRGDNNATNVLYAKPGLDLTDELIRRYDAAYGAKSSDKSKADKPKDKDAAKKK